MFELKTSLQGHTLSSDNLTIRLSHDPAELATLADEWRALLNESRVKSLFLSPEWTQLVWGHFGTPSNLWLLTARDGDGRLVGLAPMMIHKYRPFAGIQWRQLGFVAQALPTSHLDFIALPGAEADVVQGFFNLIHAEKHRWDTLNIANLPTNSPAWAVLEAQPGVVWEDAHSEEMACITFPENWDDFYTTAISSRRRKQQRKYHNLLDEAYPNRWSWEVVTDPAQLNTVMDDLIRLHQAKWKALGEEGAFGNPKGEAFHRKAAAALLEKGMLRLHRLIIDGKTVVANYGFRYGNRQFDFASGWDVAYADYSPGEILNGLMLRQAHDEGVREYDLMSGAQEYKLRWGAEIAPSRTAQWVASPRAQRERALILQAKNVWRQVKTALPSDFRRRLVRLVRPNGLNGFAIGVATMGHEAFGTVAHFIGAL